MPDTRPVVVLNVAQTGLLVIVNVSVFPSGSVALGWNEYGWPAATDVGGVPLMAGGRLPAAAAIEKGASEALAALSDTEIVSPLKVVPARLLLGVPVMRPVAVLKTAHVGLLAIENVSAFPSASVALGWNAYGWPAVTDVGGVPLMAGGLLPAATAIEKGASEARAVPSDTEIVMLPYAPNCVLRGVPDKRPVRFLKTAQAGLFAIENVSAFPSASVALGWNAYAWSAVADVGGVPDMTGGLFAARDGAALTGQASPRIAATRDDPVPRRDA